MADEGKILRVFEEWCDRRDRGEDASAEDLLRDHPAMASELRARLDALAALDATLDQPDLPEGAPREIGEFRILREIGRGGMGVVYEAEQTSMRRRVALKVLSLAITGAPSAVKRFAREARAAGRLHHTNIVPIHAMGQHAGYHYYAMEMVEGRPLSDLVREQKARADGSNAASGERTPSSEAMAGSDTGAHAYYVRLAEMFAGVAEALDLAHDEGVIHRDIKPSNLLLDVDGTLKIVDFGLARTEGAASMTLTGDLLGTPHYMSPEQAMAKRIEVDHRTDIYSLGATLYEVLTSDPPFQGKSLQELCSQIITKDPVLPRRRNARIPRDLETVVLKAMDKDRDKRYPTAGALARDLRRFAEGGAIRARRIRLPGRAWRRVKRYPVRAALAATILVLAVAGGLVAWRALAEAEGRKDAEYERLLAAADGATASSMAWVAGSERDPIHAAGATASDLLDRAIELRPERPEAYWLRAFAPGRSLEAKLADIDEARARGLPERTRQLLRAHLTGNRFRPGEDARTALDAAVLEGPPTALDDYLTGRILEKLGEPGEALRLLGRAIERAPPGTSLHFLATRARATLRMRRGEHAAALEDLLRIRGMGDDGIWTLASIAAAWHGLGNEARAKAATDAAVARARALDDAGAWHRLVVALKDGGADDLAGVVLDEAQKAHPDDRWLELMRCHSLGSSTRADEALSRGRRLVEREPAFHHAHELLALLLGDRKRYEEALVAAERAIELDPTCPNAHVRRGLTLFDLARYSEALTAFRTAAEQGPREAAPRAREGETLLRLDRPVDALRAYDAALALAPNEAWIHRGRAAALLVLDRRDEALEACRRVAELDPESAGPHAELAEILGSRLRRFEEALRAADRALEASHDDARIHVTRANALQTLKRHAEAEAAARRAIDLDPDLPDAHMLRARALNVLGRFEEALRTADRSIALDVTSEQPWQERARALDGLDRFEESLAAWERALERNPFNPYNLSGKGSVLSNRFDRHEEALALFDRALAMAPDVSLFWMNRGITCRRLGRAEEALAAYERALALDPDDLVLLRERCHVLRDLKRPVEDRLAAIDAWTAAAGQDDSEPWQLRGITLSELGRHEEAIAAWGEALARDPSLYHTHVNRAMSLAALDRSAEAEQAFGRAIELDPDEPRAHRLLVTHLIGAQRWEEALAAARRGLAGCPDDSPLLVSAANALDTLGRHEEALALLERADDSASAWAVRGFALQGLERYEEALVAYDRALGKDVEVGAGVRHERAKTLVSEKRDTEAVEAIRAILELDPEAKSMQGPLGLALLRLGRHEESLRAHDAALEETPDDVKLLVNRAAVLGNLKRLEAALVDLDRAFEIAPSDLLVLRARALLLSRLGRHEELAKACAAITRVRPDDVRAHHNQGVALLRLERFDEALACFDREAKLTPGRKTGHLARAEVLGKLKRSDKALEAYRRVLQIDPGDPGALAGAAVLVWRKDRPEETLALLDRLLRRRPDFAVAHGFRAEVLTKLERYEMAVDAYGSALALKPDHPANYRARGALRHDHLRDFDGALADFDRAVALAPDDRGATFFRGYALRDLGRLDQAYAAWARSLELDPADAHARIHRAEVLRMQQKLEEALAELARAKPTEAARRTERELERALTLALLGRDDEARAALKRSREDPDANADNRRVQAWWLLGENEEALREAVRLAEEHPDLHGELHVEALRRLGRAEEAKTLARRFLAEKRRPHLELEAAHLAAVAGDGEAARRHLSARRLPWLPDDLLRGARVHAILGDREQSRAWLDRAVKAGVRPGDPRVAELQRLASR